MGSRRSTFAASVRDNVHPAGGVVIGTEYEPKKALAARANFKEAGLSCFIDLREGDLCETLIGTSKNCFWEEQHEFDSMTAAAVARDRGEPCGRQAFST